MRPRDLKISQEAPLIVQMKFKGPEAAELRELMELRGKTQGEVCHVLVSEALESRRLRRAG